MSQAFARRFFEGRNAIGSRLCLRRRWDAARSFQIVGVASDTHYVNLRQGFEPMVYLPAYRESDWSGRILCIRTAGDAKRIVSAVLRLVPEIDPAVAVTETRTLEDNLNGALLQERIVATLGGFFGLTALLLASVGLYGVMSQTVTRRTKEIGIRMAMGAEPRHVVWMVLANSVFMVAIGAAAGTPALFLLTRYIESAIYGVEPQDPLTMGAAALLLFTVTTLAGFLPALRATKVEPMQALRHE